MKKPVYAAAQSFIFTRLYPLSQTDIPNNESREIPADAESEIAALAKRSQLEVDPPSLASSLISSG